MKKNLIILALFTCILASCTRVNVKDCRRLYMEQEDYSVHDADAKCTMISQDEQM